MDRSCTRELDYGSGGPTTGLGVGEPDEEGLLSSGDAAQQPQDAGFVELQEL